jgi:hypothetical protein
MTMTKFLLTSASVHYGSTRYPLNGLGAEWAEVTSCADIDLDELAWAIERLTGYLRPFEVRHYERQIFPLPGRDPLVIAECIIAQADGYSVRWDMAEQVTAEVVAAKLAASPTRWVETA